MPLSPQQPPSRLCHPQMWALNSEAEKYSALLRMERTIPKGTKVAILNVLGYGTCTPLRMFHTEGKTVTPETTCCWIDE